MRAYVYVCARVYVRIRWENNFPHRRGRGDPLHGVTRDDRVEIERQILRDSWSSRTRKDALDQSNTRAVKHPAMGINTRSLPFARFT